MTLQHRGRIVIAGGSGFLGQPLARHLAAAGHEVVLLSRTPGASTDPIRRVMWTPDGSTGPWAKELDGAQAVINLAGESIAGQRWSDARKRQILDSRIFATRSLVRAIDAAHQPPSVLVSGSAVGVYGPCGDEPVTELTPHGRDFLAGVCAQWEAEANRTQSDETRVVVLRTGLALARDGGALPPMLLPFWFGAGGPVGSGRQYWPWIHRDDWLSMVQFAIETPTISGPLNATAPTPLPNREFARALGRAMHRPAFMPAPAFALTLLLGEMADALVLSGQRALPAKAVRAGFAFKYSDLPSALVDLFPS
ncbi:MAG: TIGR01777 family oxidoreductase [Vicinamibacterales bacterium]